MQMKEVAAIRQLEWAAQSESGLSMSSDALDLMKLKGS